ncbi:MAG: hypothetical protein JNL39_07165, partial [Opitutaceae bacterium]|nr:hypothetical protein [Opitutaceae bacterium]
ELYHLERDLGEKHNVAAEHPEVVVRLTAFARAFVWPEKLPDPGIALPGAAGKSTAKKKSP